MEEVLIFLLWSASLHILFLNAALLIRIQLKARKKERNIPRNYSVSSPHKHSSFKRKDSWKQISFEVKTSTFIFSLWCFQCFNQVLNHQIPKNPDFLHSFLLPVSTILEWSNNTLVHAWSKQWSLISLKSVCVYMVLWFDFRPVWVIHVGSATGMSETGMRWLFRVASCKQKQAFVWRPISYRPEFIPVSCNQGFWLPGVWMQHYTDDHNQ